MVTLDPYIAQVERRLSLRRVKNACKAANPRGTSIVMITATWENGQGAADIANTLRDVFISEQVNVKRASLGREIRDLEDRMTVANRNWEAAEGDLRKFLAANQVVDPDRDSERYTQQLWSLDVLYQQALSDREVVEFNQMNLAASAASTFVNEEGTAPPPSAPEIGALNTRISSILQAIQSTRQKQVDLVEFERVKAEYEKAVQMRESDIISESVYLAAKATYERQSALRMDSDPVRELKAELTEALDRRIERIAEVREELKQKIQGLPELQRRFVVLSGEAAFRGVLKKQIESQLAQVRQAWESNVSDFSIISGATAPVFPDNSTRKLIAFAVAVVGTILSFGVVVGLSLLDTTVKSDGEFTMRLSPPLLGVLPRVWDDEPVFPDGFETEQMDEYRIIARQVRQLIGGRGARLLVVSSKHGEGTTTVAASLAMIYGRLDERVLLLDAQVRPGEHEHELKDLIPDDAGPVRGLGEYLSYQTDRVEDVIWPTVLPGVECVPRVEEAVIPDLVGSNRMKEMLEDISSRYSLVLIDTPPVLSYVDAQTLAQWADGAIFVVKSRECRVASLSRAVERLEGAGVRVLGGVLNCVDQLYVKNL